MVDTGAIALPVEGGESWLRRSESGGGETMESFVMAWWMWFVLGIMLLLAEFLTPGAFYQFFFGVGAVAVGALVALGLRMSMSAQLLLFLVLSIGSLVLLRRPLRLRLDKRTEDDIDRLEGQTAIAMEEIAVDGVGKAELRGSIWNARNIGETAIAESSRCRVERVEGITLLVRS